MQYVNLPNTNVKVSRMCLGTMMFGAQTSESDSLYILDSSLDQGINFIDTAACYLKCICITLITIPRWMRKF